MMSRGSRGWANRPILLQSIYGVLHGNVGYFEIIQERNDRIAFNKLISDILYIRMTKLND
jgi:hypothetical protein